MQNIITMEVEQRTKAWILQNQIQKQENKDLQTI